MTTTKKQGIWSQLSAGYSKSKLGEVVAVIRGHEYVAIDPVELPHWGVAHLARKNVRGVVGYFVRCDFCRKAKLLAVDVNMPLIVPDCQACVVIRGKVGGQSNLVPLPDQGAAVTAYLMGGMESVHQMELS